MKAFFTLLFLFCCSLVFGQQEEYYPKNNIKLHLPYTISWIRNAEVEVNFGFAYERKIGQITSGEIKFSQLKLKNEFPYRRTLELVLKVYLRKKKDKYFNGPFAGVVPYAQYQFGNVHEDLNAQKDTVTHYFNGMGGVLGYQLTAFKKLSLEISTSVLFGKDVRQHSLPGSDTRKSMNAFFINPVLLLGFNF
ncbi:DUF3575 domain-containing protein [Flexithrix dorotheae]|uniref:DUF3575 domain-containing protein n=1 Tax=Flexithrix dorotheae TaxID=70993 RepID=UPI000371F48B|nr:DUF3575 domain-containing protein [Flexithrix dorotheae]